IFQNIHPRGNRHAARDFRRRQPVGGVLLQSSFNHNDLSSIIRSHVGVLLLSGSQAHAWMAILRSLAASAFGSVSRSTPFPYFASTLTASTIVGSVSVRVKVPYPRSWRSQTASGRSSPGGSPWMVSLFPSVTLTSSFPTSM